MIDGEPLTFGTVRIAPAGARSSHGQLDEEGRFVLRSRTPGDGVVAGTHRAAVSAAEAISKFETRWHAPQRYTNYDTSGIEVTVTDGKGEILIELTWDGTGHKGPYIQKLPRL